MWNAVVERLPSNLAIICVILSYFVPYFVYKINQNLHKYGDPPWKIKNND
ncbi:hypothetical protein [Paraliobacillus salinarum]|nr:hypothetical protein [Paraliobacillus salinarum]